MNERADLKTVKAGAREWLGLVVLLLPTMLLTADLGVLWLATPNITAEMRPTGAQFLWITDVYGFMTAGFLVVMGTLGDRIGRGRDPPLHPVPDQCDVHRPRAAYSRDLTVGDRAGIGRGARPGVGWGAARRAVVGLGVPAGRPDHGAGPGGRRPLLPEYRDVSAGRLDLASTALFLLGILPTVYAVKRIAEHGWQVSAAVAGAAGLVFAVLFVRRQRRLTDPLLDLRLFANRSVAAALAVLFLGMMALNSVEYLVPPFLQLVGGMSPLASGLWLLPSAAAFLIGSQLTPLLARRVQPAFIIAAGTAISLIGYLLATQAASPPEAITALTVIMLGVGPISVLGTELAAPPRRRARPPRRGRPPTTWAWPWASRSPAAPPRPSTARRWRRPYRPGHPTAQRRPPATH